MRIKFLNYDIYIRKSTVAAMLSILVVILSIVIKNLLLPSDDIVITKKEVAKEVALSGEIVKPTSQPKLIPQEEIKIYITGCVVNPGIISLKKGQIVEEAIQLAGGLTDEADPSTINRVYKLTENVMLYIKSKDESRKQIEATLEKEWSSSADIGPGIDVINDSGGTILNKGNETKLGKKININKATEDELDTLPGIGKETAKTIIEYRETNGGFKNCTDLMKIPGIKESKYSKVKELISVD